ISHRYNFDRTRIVRADVVRFEKPGTILDEKEISSYDHLAIRDTTGFDKIGFSCVTSQSGFIIMRTPSRFQGLSWTSRGCPCTLSSCIIANSCKNILSSCE
ncbi:hypothetical protein CH063_15333, partial [Colletotrichum higginsianum]